MGSLLISYSSLHGVLDSNSINGCAREFLKIMGLDTIVYKGHSISGSFASKLFELNFPFKDIMLKGTWNFEKTFQKL